MLVHRVVLDENCRFNETVCFCNGIVDSRIHLDGGIFFLSSWKEGASATGPRSASTKRWRQGLSQQRSLLSVLSQGTAPDASDPAFRGNTALRPCFEKVTWFVFSNV